MDKRAQTWSFDLIVGVVLFIVIVAIFYSSLSADRNDDITLELQDGADVVSSVINCDVANNSICFIKNGNVIVSD